MINRLELALMLLLLLGSLMAAVLMANPRESATLAAVDPLAPDELATAESADANVDRLQLPSFEAFDEVGFGLLPDLAPRFAPGQP